ncbi:TetR family transcriptional regulator [Virgisporangium aliadipatigenens]|uniref:TetR family transcriptional regulator n=1 Tax=Virgisporangium aliadipatigenens TaxID=741659 RepID=A0A8J4DSA3_9ACTN|nr:TetR/AcrR family transcriptional regulator [Virgisporangium aliadipatigenens]GIJ47653.1 TetR family transcriptional regulator [Virgisporangium aliadipatigenens]
MGNREDLLHAAKRCLYEKGYALTTARDIANGAGVSLAAIGYHYGSKEALLQQALQQAIEEWGEGLGRTLGSLAGTPAERWDAVVASFRADSALWTVQFELLAQLERTPELRRLFGDANRQARIALAQLIGGAPAGREEQVGALYQAMLAGLAAQWLMDPTDVPSGTDVMAAMHAVVSTTSTMSTVD